MLETNVSGAERVRGVVFLRSVFYEMFKFSNLRCSFSVLLNSNDVPFSNLLEIRLSFTYFILFY